jgi:cellulase/cellobiase CelA1
VSYQADSHWRGGFTASVTIANTGTAAVNGWLLAFRFGGDQRVLNAWNASFSQSGPAVTLTGAFWNGVLPAGGSVTVGLLGSGSTSAAAPTAATLNGTACTLT